MMLSSGGYSSWKKIRCWPVWADGRTGCWRSSRWSRGISYWNVDLYEIDDRKRCWRNLRLIWSDLIRGGPAVEKIGRYGADDKKKCWRSFIVLKSAVDFDAYAAISIHSLHYSSSYFSFVEFIFFNCVLIFSKFRRESMMINFIWWFRYDSSSAVQKEKERSITMK